MTRERRVKYIEAMERLYELAEGATDNDILTRLTQITGEVHDLMTLEGLNDIAKHD